MNALTVPNGVAVALFGIALSAAFCDIHWTKKNRIILVVGSAAMLLMQALITYMDSWTAMQEAYPLTTHLPLAIILSVLSGKWLWPTISVLAAYLCCQLRRWVALLVIAMVPSIDWLQPAVEMVVTLPLLAPTLIVTALMRIIDALKTFDIIYATTQGGPLKASETVNLLAYKSIFSYFKMGRGAALIICFLAEIGLCCALVMILRRNAKRR